MERINLYLQELNEALALVDQQRILDVVQVLEDAYNDDRTVYIFGNGGSGANASHFAEDLAKYVLEIGAGKRIKAISLTDNVPFILALANDEGYTRIFSRQLEALASPNDVTIAISGSGNSPNVLEAVGYANQHNMVTIGVTGFDGGKLYDMVGYNLHVPCHDMGMCEAIHLLLFHLITKLLVERLRYPNPEQKGI